MGVFYEQIPVINLAPIPLSVTFDGQQITVPVGRSSLPKMVIGHAKNQNPIMGSQDPNNPSLSGARYLIAIVGKKGERQEPLTPEEWAAHLGQPCRIDTEELFADMLGPKEHVVTRGKGRTIQARSMFDAGVKHAMSADDTASME